jgi:multidrug transporter EmrE-like cation transporter
MNEISSYSWHDFVGNVGVAFIVGTYFLLQVERMRSGSVAYSLLNAVGAILILVSLVFDFNLSSMVIEIFWLGISAFGVLKALQSVRGN